MFEGHVSSRWVELACWVLLGLGRRCGNKVELKVASGGRSECAVKGEFPGFSSGQAESEAVYRLRRYRAAGICLGTRSGWQTWTRSCMSRVRSYDGMECIAGLYISVTRYRIGFMTPSLLLGAEHAVTATIRSISALKSM